MYIHRLVIIFIISVGLLSCINDSEFQNSTEEALPQQPPDVSSLEEEVKDDKKTEPSITLTQGELSQYYVLAKGFTPKQEQIITNIPFSDRIKNRTEVFAGLFLVMDIDE